MSHSKPLLPCEVAIQTVIGRELDAMLDALAIDRSRRLPIEGDFFYPGTVRSEIDSRGIPIIVHCQGEAGNAAASAASTKLIERFHPRLMILSGIAAGRRTKVKIGDVAVPRAVLDMRLAVATSEKMEGRPAITALPHVVGQLLGAFDPTQHGWHDLFHRIMKRPIPIPTAKATEYATYVASEPGLHDVVLASDDTLIRDPLFLENAARIHQQVCVGEMEAAGLIYACEARDPKVPWLVVRGVSDFGDSLKSDEFHRLASVAAASYVATFLRHGFRIGLLHAAGEASVPSSEREPAWMAHIREARTTLDAHFAGHARILGVARQEPTLRDVGEFVPSEAIQAEAQNQREELHKAGYPNDSHALLDHEPRWADYPLLVHYRRTDFATITALRKAREKPRPLSASAVIVVPRRRALILHRRAAAAATYPSRLHTIGGAFAPALDHRAPHFSLRHTLLREIDEETHQWLASADWPAVMVEETMTGFVQYVALGLQAPDFHLADIWEGRTLEVPFERLEELLMSPDWVPSGKLHVLLWLAAGAPGSPDARFGSRDAASLLEAALRHPPPTT